MPDPPARRPRVSIRIIDPVPLVVPRPMVLLRLGYRRPSQVPDRVSALIDEIETSGRTLLAPRAITLRCPVTVDRDGAIDLGGILTSTSRSLRQRLAGCREAVLFAATIGSKLEKWVAELGRAEEITRSLLADAFGSAAAIALGVELERLLGARLAEDDLVPEPRCAPGYGDWSLADQGPILQRLEAGRIGIALLDEGLMVPAKSISGVIGGRPVVE